MAAGEKKELLIDKPNVGDKSQYNFEQFETDIIHENSLSIPENNDKFQRNDLFTNCIGEPTNEAIIEKNLRFEGDSFIKIESLFIQNTGVDGTVKNCHVSGWIFSEFAYGGDPTKDGYGTIKSKMKDEWKFYSQGFSNRSEGSDIGNITAVEGVPIVSNFSADSPSPSVGDITGRSSEFSVDEGITGDDQTPSGLKAFKLSDIDDVTDMLTTLFNQAQNNPIYICIYTRGDKKVAWPVETDERKKKYVDRDHFLANGLSTLPKELGGEYFLPIAIV